MERCRRRLAPDLDIIAELTTISMTFMQRHGARLSQELGVDVNELEVKEIVLGHLSALFGFEIIRVPRETLFA